LTIIAQVVGSSGGVGVGPSSVIVRARKAANRIISPPPRRMGNLTVTLPRAMLIGMAISPLACPACDPRRNASPARCSPASSTIHACDRVLVNATQNCPEVCCTVRNVTL
jgi:hypothetical protein